VVSGKKIVMSQENEKDVGYVISHTHWDREWYLTFQEFRKWLVKLIDRLVYESPNYPEFRGFMLDGQTLVVEDYLEIRPYNEQKLKDLIMKDKVQIGPWYVLADEFLESGEGIIRNLLLGHKIGKRFGKTMKVGYVPDTFGHISQLPQLLQGFNIKYGYGFRGYPPVFGNHEEYEGKNTNTPLEHMWVSPNRASSILMLHHITGYGNCSRMCESPLIEPNGNKVFVGGISRVSESWGRLKSRQKTNLMLMMNGSDHLEPEFDITEFIKTFNTEEDIQSDVPLQLKHATLEEYFKDLEKSVNKLIKKDKNLIPSLSGEWRGSMYTQVTPGCISTRMYLKQQNYVCQRELERYAEPLSSIAWCNGGTYDSDLIWESWKWTIKNHPHDSICGCSLDRVHDDMEARFKWSLDVSSDMGLNAMAEITSGIDEKPILDMIKTKYKFQPVAYNLLTVFNSNGFSGSMPQVVEGLVATNPNYSYRLFDNYGNEIKEFTLQPIKDYRSLEGAQYIFKRFHGNWSCGYLVFPVSDLPEMGYRTYFLMATGDDTKSKSSPKINVSEILKKTFEGKGIKIQFNVNGSFDLTDVSNGVVYKQVNLFEDMADDGDEYDYASLRNEVPILSTNIKADLELIEENNVRSIIKASITMKIPEKLKEIDSITRVRTKETVDLRISSLIKIYRSLPYVEIETSFDNNAKSHRLRALVPTGLTADYSFADDHFTVMKRTVKMPPDKGWFQDMQAIYHEDTFVDITDGKTGLTAFNRGLPEFEIVKYESQGLVGNTIALTLVRGVEWLSQHGHTGRKSGLNGPNLPTPGAQCLRHFTCEYAVYPHQGDWKKGECYKNAYSFNAPPKFFDKRQIGNLRIKQLKALPAEQSILLISNPNVILTTVKKAETDINDNLGLVVRVFNSSDHEESTNLSINSQFKNAFKSNLLEENLEKLVLKPNKNQNTISITLKPSEIYTILLKY
jgi:mannosylglycerate hydrolase